MGWSRDNKKHIDSEWLITVTHRVKLGEKYQYANSAMSPYAHACVLIGACALIRINMVSVTHLFVPLPVIVITASSVRFWKIQSDIII